VAAAGNDGTTALSYPASYDSVISVGAIDEAKLVADFSQKNSQVELAAPGVAVLSTTSYTESVNVTIGSLQYPAQPVEFALRGSASGTLVDGGLATSTNTAWSGKVVLVQRGEISFYDKVRNVQLSGGVAAIISNNVEGELYATLGDGNSSSIPAVGITQADGQTLLSKLGSTTTVNSILNQPVSGYAKYDGTSMATPHVSGVAALVWSKYPQATPAQVREALTYSAMDLGAQGRDTSYGHGLVQAAAALDRLADVVGGTPAPTDTTPPEIIGLGSTKTNVRNGSFEITWTTNEPARSSVTFSTGATASSTTLNTSHRFSFRGAKGATYYYFVSSTDAAGNTATSPQQSHQN
jgi:serine protease